MEVKSGCMQLCCVGARLNVRSWHGAGSGKHEDKPLPRDHPARLFLSFDIFLSL